MVFAILDARAVDDEPDPLFPSPAGAYNTVMPVEGDGDETVFKAIGVRTESSPPGAPKIQLNNIGNIDARIIVTDRRIIVACTNFSNGGGWKGYGTSGAVFATIANSIEKSVARSRTKGLMLVGHIYYESLTAGIARDRKGWGSENFLQFIFPDPTQDKAYSWLTLQLERRTLASPLMAGIMRRAARYRAAQDIPESYRDRLVEWAAGEMHAPPAANTGALAYTLPSKRTTDV